jgi:uncharacterized protein YggE
MIGLVSSVGRTEGVAGPTVSVVGEAGIRTDPDEVVVWITLSAVHESPGPALADVAKRSKSLAALLDELKIPG